MKRIGEWTIEIIKRSDTAQGFEVHRRDSGAYPDTRRFNTLYEITYSILLVFLCLDRIVVVRTRMPGGVGGGFAETLSRSILYEYAS